MTLSGKRALIVLMIGTSLSASTAHAQYGLNLTWDDCFTGPHASLDKTVACTNSTNSYYLVCSFGSPIDIPNLGAVDWTLDIMVGTPTVPTWWTQPSNRYSVDMTNPSLAACPRELWNQSAHVPVSIGPVITQVAPNRLRVRGVWAFVAGEEQPIEAQVEYYSHTIQLNFSAGTGTDPGCATPACLVLSTLALETPGGLGDVILGFPMYNQIVSWQGGNNCFSVVPTKASSWGQLKTLYR